MISSVYTKTCWHAMPFAPCCGLDKGEEVGEPDFKPLQVQWKMEMGKMHFIYYANAEAELRRGKWGI